MNQHYSRALRHKAEDRAYRAAIQHLIDGKDVTNPIPFQFAEECLAWRETFDRTVLRHKLWQKIKTI